MTDDHAAFQAAIEYADTPEDRWVAMLVYSDYLRERGDDALADAYTWCGRNERWPTRSVHYWRFPWIEDRFWPNGWDEKRACRVIPFALYDAIGGSTTADRWQDLFRLIAIGLPRLKRSQMDAIPQCDWTGLSFTAGQLQETDHESP